MKKYRVKCEVIFEIGEKHPMTEAIQITDKNSTMANCSAIVKLMDKYPKALNVTPYQTIEIDEC